MFAKALGKLRTEVVPGLALILGLGAVACSESTSVQLEDENIDLIRNGSFEIDGAPTLDHWHVVGSSHTLVEAAPPSGGTWSLRLDSDGAPVTSFVAQAVPTARSGEVYRLTAQVRAGRNGGGAIGLLAGPDAAPPVPRGLQLTTQDTTWAIQTVTHTVRIQNDQTLWVILAALPTEVEARAGWFDLVTLDRVDTLSTRSSRE